MHHDISTTWNELPMREGKSLRLKKTIKIINCQPSTRMTTKSGLEVPHSVLDIKHPDIKIKATIFSFSLQRNTVQEK